jgi:RHS repeat-associated protein
LSKFSNGGCTVSVRHRRRPLALGRRSRHCLRRRPIRPRNRHDRDIVNHLRYGSFGQILGQTEDDLELALTYTGRQYDADSDLYYCRARWYDAQTGQFISQDPLGFVGGDANLSRYCGNSPMNFTDPSGMLTEAQQQALDAQEDSVRHSWTKTIR